LKPNIEIPSRLYKYRAFSDLTVRMLLLDELFFADPITFNDPLDSRPCLEPDLSEDKLDELLGKLQQQRRDEEVENDLDYINLKKRSDGEGESLKQTVRRVFQEHFVRKIEVELIKRYDGGIFCLSERFDSTLMWSHYGDQHKGICLGYSVSEAAKKDIHKVDYEQNDRLVKASDVVAMLAGDREAEQRIDQAVLYRKAADWEYEQEWRLIGKRGQQKNPLDLEEVTFGLKCSAEVKAVLVKAMKGRSHPVRFYEMKEKDSSFTLEKCDVNLEKLEKFPVCNHHESVSL